jgi:hypothetical protein
VAETKIGVYVNLRQLRTLKHLVGVGLDELSYQGVDDHDDHEVSDLVADALDVLEQTVEGEISAERSGS